MLLDVCLGTRSSWKILFVLSEAPGKAISRREIYSLTRLGNKVITKFLLLLEKFGVISSKKIGKTFYYSFILSNDFAKKIIEIVNFEKIRLNNPDFYVLNILRDFVYELTNSKLEILHKVILFGSYAKRTYTEKSDIDIAIVISKKDSDYELIVTDAIQSLKKRYKKEIQLHYFTIEEFNTSKNRLILEIKKDGIELM